MSACGKTAPLSRCTARLCRDYRRQHHLRDVSGNMGQSARSGVAVRALKKVQLGAGSDTVVEVTKACLGTMVRSPAP